MVELRDLKTLPKSLERTFLLMIISIHGGDRQVRSKIKGWITKMTCLAGLVCETT